MDTEPFSVLAPAFGLDCTDTGGLVPSGVVGRKLVLDMLCDAAMEASVGVNDTVRVLLPEPFADAPDEGATLLRYV